MSNGQAQAGKATPKWHVGSLERFFRRSGLFRWPLKRHESLKVRSGLQDPWRGNAAAGAIILANGIDWNNEAVDGNDFSWIRHLRALGGGKARQQTRSLISSWLDNNSSWHMQRWRPDVMGERLANLTQNYGWYGESASEEFQALLARSVAVQARCLALDWRRMRALDDRFSGLRGLSVAEAALGASRGDLLSLLDLAMPLVRTLVNEDGGHVSRMPDRHMLLLRQLVELRSAAAYAGVGIEERLDEVIKKMGTVGRMWRHGDGKMANFNGAGMINAAHVEEILNRTGTSSKVLQQAPLSGFMRFASGRTTLILDTGTPASRDTSADFTVGHGTLSFEMSIGNTQLIVNTGQTAADPNLRHLLCSTSAHSTVSIDDQNSSDPESGRIARVSNVEVGPATGGILATASHDGYESSHGILHHRKLYLAAGGGNLRGSDELEYTGAPGEIPRYAILRFHLHNRVSAAMLGNGQVLMKIKGNKTGWLFKAAGGEVGLDNSVYFDAGIRHSCQQIVMRAHISEIRTLARHELKWAFRRSDS